MRLDRTPVERRDGQQSPAPLLPDAGNFRASGPNFASSLQQHRQKDVAPTRDSRAANDSATRRGTGREAPKAETSLALADGVEMPVDALPALSAPMLSLLSTSSDSSAPAAAAASGAPRAARRRTTMEETPASPCIEVTLPNNGTRFLLSQQDGVWLLSLQDQPPMSAAELESMLKELREQFAQRGLGEVDVIV